MLKGITVILYEKIENGKDEFNAPIYQEVPVKVDNVLVGEPATDDVINAQSMYGRKISYKLAIPKGDTHEWENARVEFFGRVFKVFGIPTEGIEDMIPLDWNKKVMVECYE